MYADRVTLFLLLALAAAVLIGLFLADRHARAGHLQATSTVPLRSSGRLLVAGHVLLIAGWFGLVTGLTHLSLAVFNQVVRRHFIMTSRAILWMAPAAYIVIFVGFGTVLALVALLNSKLTPPKLTIGAFAWLGLFVLLLPYPQLNRLATVLLALGFAVTLARIVARQTLRWPRFMVVSGSVLVGAILLLTGIQQGWLLFSRARQIGSLPEARAGAPNVLLLVLDTVRAASLSLYGYERPTTPELEQWAREGATFEMALSTAPWTLTSHGTMFTGLYPNQLDGSFERRMRLSGPTLATLFQERGYLTAGFVANLRYVSYESGLTDGFVDYLDYRPSWRHVLRHSWLAHTPIYRSLAQSRSASDVVAALARPKLDIGTSSFLSPHRIFGRTPAGALVTSFLDWQGVHTDRPFFAFLNFFDAHGPYQAPASFIARFESPAGKEQGRYEAAVAYIDQEVGRLLGELRDRGILDNTIVVLTADHGELLGEHKLVGHANSLFLPVLHVPLVIRFPSRVLGGESIAKAVTLRDLGATIVDLAGLEPRVEFPGRSLVGGAADPSTDVESPLVAELGRTVRPDRRSPAWHGPMRTIFDREFQYIRRGDGKEELYAYRADRAGGRDLAGTPETRIHLDRLRELLASAVPAGGESAR